MCEISEKKMKQGEVKESLSSPLGELRMLKGWNSCNLFQAGGMSTESKLCFMDASTGNKFTSP